MPATDTEHVLVVPTQLFHSLGYFQGFCNQPQRYLDELLQPAQMSFREREAMEHDPGFKQLIPYVLLQHTSPVGETMLLAYQRGAGQGEKRLHRKRSVGIGGHISSHDALAASGDAYQEGLRRELNEEVTIGCPYREKCVGLINDDETEVGRVHLGVVHVLELEAPEVRAAEEDIVAAEFRPVRALFDELAGFETWSQICLQALYAPSEGG